MTKMGTMVLGLLVAVACKEETSESTARAIAVSAATVAHAPVAVAAPQVAAPMQPVISLAVPSASSQPIWTGGTPKSLKICCDALSQEARKLHEPNQEYAEQAAEVCERAVEVRQSPQVAIGMIAAALRGVAMPMGCRP